MGRYFPRQHFLALNVTNLGGFTGLKLLDYCIHVKKVKLPRILRWMARSGSLQINKIFARKPMQEMVKCQEIPGNLNC